MTFGTLGTREQKRQITFSAKPVLAQKIERLQIKEIKLFRKSKILLQQAKSQKGTTMIRQHAFIFVIANGLKVDPGLPRHFADR